MDNFTKTLSQLSADISAMSAACAKSFPRALDLIAACTGGIAVIGLGKSGAIASKLASTLRGAGRKAHSLSPSDIFYEGGISLSPEDIAIVVSSSGASDEILRILPILKSSKTKIIALTPMTRSPLALASSVVLNTALPHDDNDRAAGFTSSLTALAIGDLLGMELMAAAKSHKRKPAAATGQHTVRDILSQKSANPAVPGDTIFKDALITLTSRGLGAISITDDSGKLTGILTDGDVRRLLQRSQGSLTNLFLTNVDSLMTKNPKRVQATTSLSDALAYMEDNAVTVLPVTDAKGAPLGMIHLHDLVQSGLLGRYPQPPAPTIKTAAKK